MNAAILTRWKSHPAPRTKNSKAGFRNSPATKKSASALEKAFDYRGDVTITRKDGSKIEGYLFDRRTAATLKDSVVRLYPEELQPENLHLLRRHRRPRLHRTRHRRRQKLGSLDEEIRAEKSRRRKKHRPRSRTAERRLILTAPTAEALSQKPSPPPSPPGFPSPRLQKPGILPALHPACRRQQKCFRVGLTFRIVSRANHGVEAIEQVAAQPEMRHRFPRASRHNRKRNPVRGTSSMCSKTSGTGLSSGSSS